ELVKIILSKINVSKEREIRLLNLACQNGRSDIVKMLLDNGFKPSEWSFYVSCQKGYVDIVKLLINDNRTDPNSHTNFGTALEAASNAGQYEVVKILLENPRVNPNIGGGGAIEAAIYRGHLDILKLLLDKVSIDRDLVVKNIFKKTEYYGFYLNLKMVIKTLLESPKVVKHLTKEELSKWEKIIDEKLLESIYTIDKEEFQGSRASMEPHMQLNRIEKGILLREISFRSWLDGVGIHVDDNHYYVSLHVSNPDVIYFNRFDRFKDLLEYLKISACLDLEMRYEHGYLFNLLKNAKLNLDFDNNRTIYHVCLNNSYTKELELLLKRPEIDPTFRNNVLIRKAYYYGNKDIIRILLNDERVKASLPKQEFEK
ncbi:hypothetical protein EBU94_09085, partial [bacterium]|nr:hypothetical protein [bacterium]